MGRIVHGLPSTGIRVGHKGRHCVSRSCASPDIEATSKIDAARVLSEVGVDAASDAREGKRHPVLHAGGHECHAR